MSGKTDVAKCRMEEAAGVLTSDDKFRAKGQDDQAVGEIKEVAETSIDKVKEIVTKLQRGTLPQGVNGIR